MHNLPVTAILLALLAGGVQAADKELTYLDASKTISPVERIDPVTGKKQVTPAERTRQVAINIRRRKTQEQFEASIKRLYPDSYRMISALEEDQRDEVFYSYRAGDTMHELRKKVIKLYAETQKPQ